MPIDPCFGPLGGLCAFLGALGLLLASFGLIGTFAQGSDAWERIDPFLLFVGLSIVGIMLLAACIILAVINQGELSPGCPGHAAWTGSMVLFAHLP